jgi:hypothetical protein
VRTQPRELELAPSTVLREVNTHLDTTTTPHFTAPLGIRRHLPLFVFLPGLDGTGMYISSQLEGLKPHYDVRCLCIPVADRQGYDALAKVREERPAEPLETFANPRDVGGRLPSAGWHTSGATPYAEAPEVSSSSSDCHPSSQQAAIWNPFALFACELENHVSIEGCEPLLDADGKPPGRLACVSLGRSRGIKIEPI